MSERRRHQVLEPFLAQTAGPAPEGSGVVLEVAPFRGFLGLRGAPDDDGFMEAARSQLGQPLPVAANTFTEGDCQVYWLGPDEWLVMTEPGREVELQARLAAGLAGRHHALTNLTGGQICMRLGGDNARDVLATGCTLDFHPRVFRPGQCAQTVLGKASMLIGLSRPAQQSADAGEPAAGGSGPPVDGGVFDIVVRRTFAEYAAWWLYRSALEYGVWVHCPRRSSLLVGTAPHQGQ